MGDGCLPANEELGTLTVKIFIWKNEIETLFPTLSGQI